MSCSWEVNCRSGNALAMYHRLKWLIHLRAQGLSNGDEHPPTLLMRYGTLLLFTRFYILFEYWFTCYFTLSALPLASLHLCKSYFYCRLNEPMLQSLLGAVEDFSVMTLPNRNQFGWNSEYKWRMAVRCNTKMGEITPGALLNCAKFCFLVTCTLLLLKLFALYHMKSLSSVLEQTLSHKFAFDTKFCKTFVECRMYWKCLKFTCCQMRMQTSSHPYYNCVLLQSMGSSVVRPWVPDARSAHAVGRNIRRRNQLWSCRLRLCCNDALHQRCQSVAICLAVTFP